jgi:coatomer subunit beta
MTIHKYEIIFDILLVNRENKSLQNVTVEFSTQGDSRISEKASSINLGPNQSGSLKCCVKLSSSEVGLIFASITYENNAGITQAYLITNEIVVDLIDFIYPARIDMETFRKCWSKYDWENRITMNTQLE